MAYNIGQGILVDLRFTEPGPNGVPADPTTVVVTVYRPSGVPLTPAVTNPSVGLYQCEFEVDEGHRSIPWRIKAQGTGAIKAVRWLAFKVDPDPAP